MKQIHKRGCVKVSETLRIQMSTERHEEEISQHDRKPSAEG